MDPDYDMVYTIIYVATGVVAILISLLSAWKFIINRKHYAPRSRILMLGLIYSFMVLGVNNFTLLVFTGFEPTWRSALLLPGLVWLMVGIGITGSLSLRHNDQPVADMIREIFEGEPCHNPQCIDYRHRLVKALETEQSSKL